MGDVVVVVGKDDNGSSGAIDDRVSSVDEELAEGCTGQAGVTKMDDQDSPGAVLVDDRDSTEAMLVEDQDSPRTMLVDDQDSPGAVLIDDQDSSGAVLVDDQDSPGAVLVDDQDSPGAVLVDDQDSPVDAKMAQEYQYTRPSYGSMAKDACPRACLGLFLLVGSIWLLIFNERRTVKQARDVNRARMNFAELDLSNYIDIRIPLPYHGKLVYMVGDLKTSAVLTDPVFGVSSATTFDNVVTTTTATNTTTISPPKPLSLLKLVRTVEMFQWQEIIASTTNSQADGSTRTEITHSYSQDWSSSWIDSSLFKEAFANRTNPPFPFEPLHLIANGILLGNRLLLLERLVKKISWLEPLNLVSLDNVPDATLKSKLVKETNNSFFYKATSNTSISSAPLVGDARIAFSAIMARDSSISILAQLNRTTSTLDAYDTKRGHEFLLVEQGMKTAAEMFAKVDPGHATQALILRSVGFLLLIASFLLLWKPWVILICDVVDVGGFVIFLVLAPYALFVAAVSWFAYEPLYEIPVFLAIFVASIWLSFRCNKTNTSNDDTDNPPNENDGQNEPINKNDNLNEPEFQPNALINANEPEFALNEPINKNVSANEPEIPLTEPINKSDTANEPEIALNEPITQSDTANEPKVPRNKSIGTDATADEPEFQLPA